MADTQCREWATGHVLYPQLHYGLVIQGITVKCIAKICLELQQYSHGIIAQSLTIPLPQYDASEAKVVQKE